MNITLVEYWSILLGSSSEEIHELYNTNEEWRPLLDNDDVLYFLSKRFGIDPVATFSDFLDTIKFAQPKNTLFDLFIKDEDDFFNYLSLNETTIDPWTVIQIIRTNNQYCLIDLEECQEKIEHNDLFLSLYLFTAGTLCCDLCVDTLLSLRMCKRVTAEKGWGPLVLGMIAGNNADLFEYIYGDFFSDQLYTDSKYYQSWMQICQLHMLCDNDVSKLFAEL